MSVLHIISNYFYTPLYSQLLSALDKLNVENRIHVPIQQEHLSKKNDYRDNRSFSFSKVPSSRLLRALFFPKILNASRALIKVIRRNKPDIIHAHTLLSDGAVAYRLYEKFGIPYYVVIRYTDLMFLKEYWIARWLGRKIIRSAETVCFVSSGHTDELLSYFPEDEAQSLAGEFRYFPNGLDPFWLKNINSPKELDAGQIKLLFVGDFTPRKNVLTSIKVAILLKEKGIDAHLTLVGWVPTNIKPYMNQVQEACKDIAYIDILDHETNKDNLKNIYRQADIFIMPSIGETFGLTYIEALSQGLPLIFTKNQGIDTDKYYDKDEVFGYAVNCMEVEEIAEKVEKIIENYSDLSAQAVKTAPRYNWDKIAKALKWNYAGIIDF